MSTAEVAVAKPEPSPQGHPPAIWFFFWGEFAERSSYYGMRAILFVYMTDMIHGLKMDDDDAGTIYSIFKMACYCLPILGGFLADRFFGRYWTIVGFSVPYVLGHFILGYENVTCLIVALCLLAGGSGVIKPNISTLLGLTYDQKRPGQPQLRSAALLWFYVAVNVGALISQIVMPELRVKYGYAIAFAFPAWVMVGALIIFALGKPHYAVETREHHELTPAERHERWLTLTKLFGVFGIMSFFWMAYEHNDSVWIKFIEANVDLQITESFTAKQDQLQFLNAACVILMVPAFNFLFKRIDPKQKVFTAAVKMTIGFVFTAAAVGVMALAAWHASASTEKISIAWPIAAYVVLTVGEILVYGTGLDLAYSVAPKSMKGFVTACFLLTNTLGNFLNSFFLRTYNKGLTPTQFYGLTMVIVLLAAVAFYFVARRLNTQSAPE